MTTIGALVAAAPAPDRGVLTQIVNGLGEWRHVVELADPAAGSGIVWHDITAFMPNGAPFTGYEYTRGADDYQGRYRASIATLDLFAGDDSLAPWNPDTSTLFGVHVDLGPGLLIRSGFIRVVDDTVVEWNPRFTNKVEEWGDSSYSRGKVRQHRVVARDTMTSLVEIPLPATFEENWSDRMYHFLTDSGWVYGSAIYGAQFESDTTTPILVLPDRPATSSAINELDAICDPVGLVWYTNRLGQLVVRPRVEDTFHADAFAAGATGDEWPGDVSPVAFTWWACTEPDGTEAAAYAVDHSPAAPFGFDENERNVINHVRVVSPAGTFDDDDPISIQRYDRHTFQASWIADNDVVAAALLDFRANATVEARPLHTTLDLPGFHNGADTVDFLGYIAIDHRNRDDGLAAYGNGYLRNYIEQVAPRGCDVDWRLTITFDIYNVDSDAGLLPVEDLALVDVTDTLAEFSWTNPTQVITPTNTQMRLLAPAAIWATVGYPIAGVEWSSLDASTGYQFQVRLIRVVDGLITHVSPSRTLDFTTDPTTVPDVGPIGDDGETDVEFPPPDPGCTLEWKLESSVDGTTWVSVTTGTDTTAPWEVTIPDVVYDGSKLYRVCSREVCAGVPGAWSCSKLYTGECSDPPALSGPPFDDAALRFYLPAICPVDVIVEAISEQRATRGFQFDDFVIDGDGNVVLVSAGQGIVAYGANPHMTFIPGLDGLTDDATLAAKVLVTHQPTAPVTLFNAAGLFVEAIASGAAWKIRGNAIEAGAGTTTITGTAVLAFGAWYDIAISHDTAAGDLRLYVDGLEDVHALGTVGLRHNPGYYQAGVPQQSLITNCAVWGRALVASELPGYIPPVTVTINQKAGQSDPTTSTPVLYTITFSEAVTGFTAADVTLGGTAPGKVGTLTGTGASYELSVAVTRGGTVVASIATAVCTSVATGAANQASTSSDDTITITPVTVTINQGSSQTDPASSSPIVFDVVFSTSVTGFGIADVTLSGTAGATTVAVSGTGTTYLVNVSGMTGNGTVIATIPAAIATSAGGIGNEASTSTDNTVTWATVPGSPYAWFDAADASTITSSAGVVSQWNDKSGNGRHLTVVTTGPTTGTRTINSRNVLDFVPNQKLGRSSMSGWSQSAFTVFVVCEGDADHTDFRRIMAFFVAGTTDYNNTNGMILYDGNTAIWFGYYSNNAGVDLSGSGATPLNMYTVRKTGTGSNQATVWRGNNAASSTATNNASGTPNRLYIGGASDDAAPAINFDGTIAEIIMYSTALSDADRNSVWSYLSGKWGV